MIGRIALSTAALLVLATTAVSAQEPRPAPGAGGAMGPGMMQPGGMPGGGMMMMCQHMPMGGMPMPGMTGGMPMPGMTGGMAGMGAVMAGDPKAGARALRLRADMLKAMSEVLQRHAEQLEKGQ